MNIVSLRIRNFRCLRNLELELDGLTALLGRNGVGKSCVLHALVNFYDTKAPISEEDFFNRQTADPIEISVVYGRLRDDEVAEFQHYVSNDQLRVTKRITLQDGAISQKYFAATPQFPEFAQVRLLQGARERTQAWNNLVDAGVPAGLQRARAAAEVEQLMQAFEAANPGLLRPIEREEQFFGPPNIGGGKLDNYTKFVHIPAVKDVSEELTGKRDSSLNRLLDIIVHRRINAREDIAQRKAEIQEQVQQLYQAANLPELHTLGEDLSALLEKFSPGARLILNWDEPQAQDFPLPSATPRLIEDEFEGDIEKKGHGLQRALLITLLQYLAQIREPAAPQANPEVAEVAVDHDGRPSPSVILAVEEPELYLHPLRAKYLASLFNELTGPADPPHPASIQIIFTSHSPHFINLSNFENIRIIRKLRHPDGAVPETEAYSFGPVQAIAELGRIAQLQGQQVTLESFRSRIIPVMGSATSEGFFADSILLVEGPGDAGIIFSLQQLMGKNWLRRGIGIIAVDGKNNLDRPAMIFRGFRIPTFILFDGDAQNQGTNKEENSRKSNHLLLRLVGAPEVDFPPTQVADTWAVFHHKIEDEISAAITPGKFDELTQAVATEYSIGEPSRVLKNYHSASALIARLYQDARSVPILERIVDAVSQMVP